MTDEYGDPTIPGIIAIAMASVLAMVLAITALTLLARAWDRGTLQAQRHAYCEAESANGFWSYDNCMALMAE